MEIEMKPTYQELEQALKHILNIGVGTMGIVQQEMRKLNIEDIKNIPEEQRPYIENLNNIMIVVNNVIHPSFKIYESFFKDSEKTVEFLSTLQKAAVNEKRVDYCPCVVCNDMKNNIESEIKDAPAS